MNVELNLEELEQIVEALNQKHDALSRGVLKFSRSFRQSTDYITD